MLAEYECSSWSVSTVALILSIFLIFIVVWISISCMINEVENIFIHCWPFGYPLLWNDYFLFSWIICLTILWEFYVWKVQVWTHSCLRYGHTIWLPSYGQWNVVFWIFLFMVKLNSVQKSFLLLKPLFPEYYCLECLHIAQYTSCLCEFVYVSI